MTCGSKPLKQIQKNANNNKITVGFQSPASNNQPILISKQELSHIFFLFQISDLSLNSMLSKVIIKNLSESFIKKMSCQQIAMRKLLNQKYEQYVPNLNPFSNILFSENWSWPQMHYPQPMGTKSKPSPAKLSSTKPDILNWFLSLTYEQKCAVSMIKNQNFLYSFLRIYHEWNPQLLYHIYQHRKIPNYLSKNAQPQVTQEILSYLCIAWFDEPVIYLKVESLQSQGFFQKFIKWMEKVSNNKIFEYAHKIKNKLDPQENLLWFTEKSFQSLQSWIINEFQKVIVKNYYNKNNYELENYEKIKKLQKRLCEGPRPNISISSSSQSHVIGNNSSTSNGSKLQIQSLLSTKIAETKNKTQNDFKEYQEIVKSYEDFYYEETALLLDYERENDKDGKDQQKKKKKKSKKRNKKKNNQGAQNVQSQENILQDEKFDLQESSYHSPNNQLKTQYQQIGGQNKNEAQDQIGVQESLQNTLSYENQAVPLVDAQLCPPREVTDNCEELQEQKQKQIIIVEQKMQKSKSEISGNSDDWSNVETTKTTKKSGHSHPQFNQFERKREHKTKRSLSPNENRNSISKLKRKNRKLRGNQISSWNGDQSITDNNLQSYEGQQNSNKQEIAEKQTSELVDQKQNEQISQSQTVQLQKKKKKKPNKTNSLLKQLSKKVGLSLLSRQLNNFIDALSIQTNNLVDHKIVSFQRIRFFVQSLFPTSQAILFGSNAVGLSLPTSDIDIMLFNLPCTSREQAIQILAHLAVQINTLGWIVSCSTYFGAKVPIVKLQIDPTVQYMKTKRKCDYLYGSMLDPRYTQHLQLKSKKDHSKFQNKFPIIKVDLTININQQGLLGGQSTQLMKEWMSRYPQINPCILAFKYILAQRGFSSNFRGGIGSYCLFVMVASYIKEYPQLQQLDESQFFVSTLKFYGQQFENQIKSIALKPLQQSSYHPYKSCFISVEDTINLIYSTLSQPEDMSFFSNIQTNPLRIFDPINNRIMSGSCHLYPQIKSQFRRIYKQFQQMRQLVQKQVELTISGIEVNKMLENKKTFDKWLNKYQSRTMVNIKHILNGGY